MENKRVKLTIKDMGDITLKLYPDSMHELLHDRCCGKVLQDILRWLESKA